MRFILLVFIGFSNFSSLPAQQVAQYLNQVVSYPINKDNPPTLLYLSLNSSDVTLQHIRGTRIMITGQVHLNISNLFFLETLISRGRYHLYLTPDGNRGLRLEDKVRQAMILKGKPCTEKVRYVLLLPETIQTVVFEDKTTGIKEVRHIKQRNSDQLTTSSQEKQVTISEHTKT